MFDPIQMEGLIRYANRVRIKDEDLAQHSYCVAFYCFQIANEYNITDEIRNKVIAMAIIHDIGECFTSDLPHDVKYENPELKELCDKLEKKYVNELPEISPLWNELEDKKDSVEYAIIKLADSMSVLAYSKRELLLGNKTPEMLEIFKNAEERIAQWADELRKRLGENNGEL